MHRVFYNGGLTKVGEYKKTDKGGFLPISIARNYYEKDGDDFVEIGTAYENLMLFGKQAELFYKSKIELGTQIIICGERKGRILPSYTDKNGIEHPESFQEGIYVEMIGVALSHGKTVTVEKSSATKATTTTKKVTETKKTKGTKKVSKPKEEEIFEDDDEIFSDNDDIFEDDEFGFDDEDLPF